MADYFEVTEIIPAAPDRVYRAWLDSSEHGAMTGGSATADGNIGGTFNIMDGYITGTNLELEPDRRIVQAWRTTDFPDGSPDSRLEIELTADGDGCRITLRHGALPEGQGDDYKDGWAKYYFEPMKKYFSGDAGESSSESETTRMPAIAMPPAEGWEPAEEPRREDDVKTARKKAKPAKKKAKAKAAPKAKKAAKKPAKPKKAAKPAKKAAPKKKAAAKKPAPKKKAAAKKAAKKAKKPAKKKGLRR
jgi:uncharacterized protein YndB with AHSA1/START domain